MFILAKIPTDKPWEVAAWVPMGDFILTSKPPCPDTSRAVHQRKNGLSKFYLKRKKHMGKNVKMIKEHLN
ncbi:hypothetical protein [Neobacillus sp. NPDC093127]|uniref:hypothetical protein n=1 Tax=Neobacillus sp. NPDC093127 TaxID=3364296 RepID=UPI0038194815